MILRLVLIVILATFAARLFWRVVDSFVEGLSGNSGRRDVPGVHMVRDPVCGTFVLPGRAVILVDGRSRVYFCSEACRDKYRARTA